MTFVIRTAALLAAHAELQRLGDDATFIHEHRYSREIANVENRILNCRAFGLTYRLDDDSALAHLDPSIVSV